MALIPLLLSHFDLDDPNQTHTLQTLVEWAIQNGMSAKQNAEGNSLSHFLMQHNELDLAARLPKADLAIKNHLGLTALDHAKWAHSDPRFYTHQSLEDEMTWLDGGSISVSEMMEKVEYTHSRHLVFESPQLFEHIVQEIQKEAPPLSAREYHEATLLSQTPAMKVAWISDEIGYGLFAAESIEEGAFICEYTGLVRKNDRRDFLNGFLCQYPVCDDIGRNYVIDARPIGHFARFANHSKNPNCKQVTLFDGMLYHIVLIATRRIEPSDEIRFNYGQGYWNLRGAPVE
ncbi:MAG: hypothetical protein S4CHLAM102_09950 [Chlamydiia bacterium]|nr:hypothetical protein [Chlamydiia bacterium]